MFPQSEHTYTIWGNMTSTLGSPWTPFQSLLPYSNSWLVFLQHRFAYYALHLGFYTVCSLLCQASFAQNDVCGIHPYCCRWLKFVYSFSLLHSIPLCGYTYHNLSILLWWVLYKLWLLQIMLLWTVLHACFGEHRQAFLLLWSLFFAIRVDVEVNIFVNVSCPFRISAKYIFRNRIAGSNGMPNCILSRYYRNCSPKVF